MSIWPIRSEIKFASGTFNADPQYQKR